MKIAISKGTGGPKFQKYAEWLMALNPEVECIELSQLDQDEAIEALQRCHGLLLSGGKDIHPNRYKQNGRLNECFIDEERDIREWDYMQVALERNMPVLGICRGMQMMNVYFDGTLVVDISSDIAGAYEHRGEGEPGARQDRWHFIHDVRGEEGRVNSSHHQAVAQVAAPFTVLATAPDGVIEAMESTSSMTSPLLAVQWHPERMPYEGAFSRGIAEKFFSYL